MYYGHKFILLNPFGLLLRLLLNYHTCPPHVATVIGHLVLLYSTRSTYGCINRCISSFVITHSTLTYSFDEQMSTSTSLSSSAETSKATNTTSESKSLINTTVCTALSLVRHITECSCSSLLVGMLVKTSIKDDCQCYINLPTLLDAAIVAMKFQVHQSNYYSCFSPT
jgi:hypothetical protein